MEVIFQFRALAAVPAVKGPTFGIRSTEGWVGFGTEENILPQPGICRAGGYLWSLLKGNTAVSDLVQTKYSVEWLETET